MVTLYDRDAQALSSLLAVLVRYHEDPNSRPANLESVSNWGTDGGDGPGSLSATFGTSTRLAALVGTTLGKDLAVADYLSGIRAEIDAQLESAR